jgi:uncharacterized protein YpmB
MSAQHSTQNNQHSEDNQVYKGGPAMIIGFLLLFIFVAYAALYWMGMHPTHTTEHAATHETEMTK